MKTTSSLLAAVAALTLAAQAADFPLVDAVECRVRGGLANFLGRAEKGGEVSIAYFGGSITAANGWRPKTLAWFKQQYPKVQFKEINAAIGGTGSDLGVFRNQYDVLRHKPNLVFVEFAVNDGGADPVRIHQTMEGIVRQTWKADPTTDICFVYTLAHNQLDDLMKGKFQRSASAMEAIATHYGIPSIHFGLEVAKQVKEGKLVFKGELKKGASPMGPPMIFSTDGVHPLPETGHELYLQTIQHSWPALVKASAGAMPHKLGAPLRADNWEAAKMVPLALAMMQGQWEKLDPAKNGQAKAFASRMPDLWKACAPGATLTFAFKGKAAAIYDLVGPDGGIVTVKLDDKPERKATMIDGYCTYSRIAKLDCGSDLPEGLHRVTVKLTDQVPDKEKILFEKNRAELKQHPERFKDNVWYAGALMLLGDLAE
jgi:lysophospholipase L1-like esterase